VQVVISFFILNFLIFFNVDVIQKEKHENAFSYR